MAHLDSTYTSFRTFLSGADQIFATNLLALNNSTVGGNAVFAIGTNDDGERYLNVAIAATGLTPGKMHAQHIHGRFDANGNPIDSNVPTLSSDTDLDGFIEVLEGVAAYGDVLLPLVREDDKFPVTQADGELVYIQSFSLDVDANFFSPVTGTDYEGEDLLPLFLRELVLHGQIVPDGEGAGTGGEVDGGTNGYIPILPVAAGEVQRVGLEQALDLLEDQADIAGERTVLSHADNIFSGGVGNDFIRGRGGNDSISGRGENDTIRGDNGNDVVRGNAGNDRLLGNDGNDFIFGGDGRDVVFGGSGADRIFGNDGRDLLSGRDGADTLNGGSQNDRIHGGSGADLIRGGDGSDVLTGGKGVDVFVYADEREGKDTIRDFKDGEDSISLSQTDFTFADVTVVDALDDTLIRFGHTTIKLQNVDAGAIGSDDFLF